ncbi:MAG TPA: nucleotidyltransferase [Candidatus Dorea intestinavium]|nr:nucleotidyltransferase [Candidatus Dorea intestinavium]
MSVVGLITEYNPFHNGHLHHLKKAKELTGADQVVVIMSGDYVQRGAPAFMPKHLRAKMALECGATMVLELPNLYATASAEIFAYGAVSILHHLGIVDFLCFGSETGELKQLEEMASFLLNPPLSYVALLKAELKKGLSYPSAREKSLLKALNNPELSEVIKNPNNILGIEYLKALKSLNSQIKPFTIKRIGASYNDETLQDSLSSASAIRSSLCGTPSKDLEIIEKQVPSAIYDLFKRHYLKDYPLSFDDYSLLLKEKILTNNAKSLLEFVDINEDLANKIMNTQNRFVNTTQFITLLKTKDLTYAKISRALLHLVLDIKKTDLFTLDGTIKAPTYVRVLGFKKEWSSLLSLAKKNSSIPIITKLSKDSPLAEIYASNLYQSVVTNKYQTPFLNEHQKSMQF